MTKQDYQREVGAAARKIAPGAGGDKESVEGTVWDFSGDWEHLVDDKLSADAWGEKMNEVASDIADAILVIHERESREIAKALDGLGFSVLGTGGGCRAYYIPMTDAGEEGPHFLISDDNCGLPLTWDTEAFLGYYDPNGDEDVDAETVEFDTVRELVDQLGKGRAHSMWKRRPTSAAVSTDDLDVVNRHRHEIGMKPIDLTQGWTAEEIRQQADSIRKSGRMVNPKSLKGRLLAVPPR